MREAERAESEPATALSAHAPGLDVAAVSAWLTDAVPGATGPFAFELIAAGGSNLTYLVTDAAGTVRVLRRPPVGRGLESAHDMDREVTIISALGRHGAVPVPECLAHCTDASVTGAGFYVMAFVDGVILRDRAAATGLDRAQAAAATQSLVETQVAFHTIDLAAVGLADLGRHGDYVRRQLHRWRRQIDAASVRPLPVLDELHDRLSASVPPERVAPALVHGDYRFDNTILGPDHEIVAVLDWELGTTGDPIADFAWSLQYWSDPTDEFSWLTDPPTRTGAFPTRSEVVTAYAEASGFDLHDLAWYEVFCWWKQACVVEGVHGRRLKGQAGGLRAASVDAIARRVDTLLDGALAGADALDL